MDESFIDARNKKSTKVAIFYFGLLALLLLFGMSSNVITILIAIAISISFLFVDNSSIIATMFLYYPFYCIFKFNGVGVSYYNLLIVFAVFGLLIYKNENRILKLSVIINKRLASSLIILCLLCLYMLLISAVRSHSVPIIQLVVDYLIPFLFVISALCTNEDVDIERIVTWFCIGIIVAGLVGGRFIPVSNLSSYISPKGYRIGGIRLIRLQGLTVNPNYFSADVNLAIVGLFAVPSILGRKLKPIEVVIILALIILGLMSLSKSFLTTLAITLIVLMILLPRRSRITYFLIGILVVCLVTFMILQDNLYLNAIISRFSSADSTEALTSTRSLIWAEYIRYLAQHPDTLFLGNGIDAGLPSIGGIEHTPHNFYLECLYYIGIFGTIIFICLIINVAKDKNFRNNKMVYAPLLIFMTRAFAISIFQREALATWILFSLIFLTVRVNKDLVVS